MPVYDEYVDVLTGTTPEREAYQRLLEDARLGKFSHVIAKGAPVAVYITPSVGVANLS